LVTYTDANGEFRFVDLPILLGVDYSVSATLQISPVTTTLSAKSPFSTVDLSVDVAPGDITRDGVVGAKDIDKLFEIVRDRTEGPDLNGDGEFDGQDVDHLVRNILNTKYGDANLDGEFDQKDLDLVHAAGTYDNSGPAGWAQGDWDGDGKFTSSDLLKAFKEGSFVRPPASIPAPPLIQGISDSALMAHVSDSESRAKIRKRTSRTFLPHSSMRDWIN
jgi:hypothetical protein